MELIEKEQVIELLRKHRLYPADNADDAYLNGILANIEYQVEQMQPTTAHWIDKTDWTGMLGYCQYQCSNCGFTKGSKPFSRCDGKGSKVCEECGAVMQKG